jgi:hypothetical protein
MSCLTPMQMLERNTPAMPHAAAHALMIFRNQLSLAQAIADRCARSEVELYAKTIDDGDGKPRYDTSQPSISEDGADWKKIVSVAMRYIELRADELPFVMHRINEMVWFEEKP